MSKAEKCFAVKNDIATEYAEKTGITVKEATQRVNDIIDVIVDFIANPEVDGVMFRQLFTIEKVVKKARTGKMPVNGVSYKTPSAQKLKISTGKIISEKLNG